MAEAIEAKYCRAPLARAFNKALGVVWIPNLNISFSKKLQGDELEVYYQSGRPDAEARRYGRVIDIECKAAFEKYELSAWAENQRKWFWWNSDKTATPYYLAVWIGKSRDEPRGDIYMIPADGYLMMKYATMSFEKAKEEWKSFVVHMKDGNCLVEARWWRE